MYSHIFEYGRNKRVIIMRHLFLKVKYLYIISIHTIFKLSLLILNLFYFNNEKL